MKKKVSDWSSGEAFYLIAKLEGCKLTAYRCPAVVWTIGYGTTRIDGKPVAPGQRITQAKAGDLLTAALGVRCIQETGVATVMYARGALAKPSIFLDHKRLVRGEPVYEMTSGELKALLLRHLRLAREWTRGKNPEKRIRGLLAAHVHSLPNAKNLRADLCRDDAEAIETILDRWIP